MSENRSQLDSIREFAKHFAAGGISAVISKTATAPIERVKLLLQTQKINSGLVLKYNGPVDCIVRVYREQGITSFWRGNFANIFRYFPNHALNFAFKDRYKKIFVGSATKEDNFWRLMLGSLAAGGAAGGTALFVGYPLDMARTRLATDVSLKHQTRQFTGTISCLGHVVKNDGILGVYRGFGIALLGVVVFKALFLGGYDIAKAVLHLESAKLDKTNSLLLRFFVAQAVTTTVGTLCYPLDTVRRQMMLQVRTESGEYLYSGGWDCFRKIWRREGISGFFPGLSVNIMRGVGGALLLVGYDEVKKLLNVE